MVGSIHNRCPTIEGIGTRLIAMLRAIKDSL
jgi:hypothetical protein